MISGQGSMTTNQLRPPSLFQGQADISGQSGNDALNLIILSPLTPSSLPPPVLANTRSDALIRGSLRDILGPGLAEVIEQSSAPLVPGQRLPNAAAGGGQFCTVVRSGETVPFRLSARAGGRILSRQECQAMGQVLDAFIPTYLRTFVTRDAALAGLNRVGTGAGRGASSPWSGDAADLDNLNTNTGDIGNGIFDNPNDNSNDGFNSLFNTNLNADLNSNTADSLNVVGGLNTNSARRQGTDSNTSNRLSSTGGNSASNNLSDFISVRQDISGCSILVPTIVPQC
ncbi:hypothetical protein ElyMa_005356900 [Elysia marginata]|uniref:Uncharacterized protein n=1 Tax=Elysia marginata TaxID=1093978 RepID=A0AAV4EC93_9GAST|nr:hypothetical protein ElyMa_005356900 [Elysia marginata]